VQYDFGKTIGEGRFVTTGFLNSPPTVLLTALSALQAIHQVYGNRLAEYLQAMDNPQQSSRIRVRSVISSTKPSMTMLAALNAKNVIARG
jgi:hypothetical protein